VVTWYQASSAWELWIARRRRRSARKLCGHLTLLPAGIHQLDALHPQPATTRRELSKQPLGSTRAPGICGELLFQLTPPKDMCAVLREDFAPFSTLVYLNFDQKIGAKTLRTNCRLPPRKCRAVATSGPVKNRGN